MLFTLRSSFTYRAFILALLTSTSLTAAPQQSGIPGVIRPGVEVELVKEGFQFTEGPVGAIDGTLFFTDLRANRIYRLDVSGKMEVVHEQTEGANGLALASKGVLFAAGGDGKRIARVSGWKLTTLLTEGADHQPLMAPNDLIMDAKGGLYFTDPGPRPLVAGRKAYVYYLPAGAKTPILLDDEITRPNGITLTLDGKTLLVDDTVGDTVYAFDVLADGRVTKKRPFVRLHDTTPGEESGADGMALDREGRLYVTSATGVQIFDRTGQYLGTIKVPRQSANVAFAGPGKRVLYVTAREGLYRIKTLTQGPERLGK